MGYQVKITKSTLKLNEAQQQAIFEVWNEFFIETIEKNKIKDESEDFLEKQIRKFNEGWNLYTAENAQNATNLADIFDSLWIEHKKDAKGCLKITGYEQKMRGQIELFKKISHIVTPGEHIFWKGEDNAKWCWFFDGQNLLECEVSSNYMDKPLKLSVWSLNQKMILIESKIANKKLKI